MVQRTAEALARLYETDETAWLEATANLIRDGRIDQIDGGTLAEYLTDMAKRDRREVVRRLVVLLTHLLKWEQQPERRSGSWRSTIRTQRRELRQMFESGTLRNHALSVLAEVYAEARLQAADETELELGKFPVENPWDLDTAIREPDAKPSYDCAKKLRRLPQRRHPESELPSHPSHPMTTLLEVELPADLDRFRLPDAVAARLQALLDRQDAGQPLAPQERAEAEGLVDLAELLTLLRLRAERHSA